MSSKKRMVVIYLIITIALIVVGCSSDDANSDTNATVETETVGTKEEPIEEPVEEDTEVEIIEDEDIIVELTDEEILIDNLVIVEAIMVENFEGIFKVEYDEDNQAFILMMIDEELVAITYDTLLGISPYALWDELFTELTILSKTVSEYTDEHVAIIVVNPFEIENALLITQNGEQLYNLFE